MTNSHIRPQQQQSAAICQIKMQELRVINKQRGLRAVPAECHGWCGITNIFFFLQLWNLDQRHSDLMAARKQKPHGRMRSITSCDLRCWRPISTCGVSPRSRNTETGPGKLCRSACLAVAVPLIVCGHVSVCMSGVSVPVDNTNAVAELSRRSLPIYYRFSEIPRCYQSNSCACTLNLVAGGFLKGTNWLTCTPVWARTG